LNLKEREPSGERGKSFVDLVKKGTTLGWTADEELDEKGKHGGKIGERNGCARFIGTLGIQISRSLEVRVYGNQEKERNWLRNRKLSALREQAEINMGRES